MSDDKVRCTSCGRSFQHRAMAPKARCMYCGGRLAGPSLQHLELVEPGDPAAPGDPSAEAPPAPVPVLAGRGPSRWKQPVLWLHELAVLAMLIMGLGLTVALLVRNDPLLPPSAVRSAVLVALPALWVGGICLRVGTELFTGPARSVLMALPPLVLGLALGLPSVLARFLARLQGKLFGVWGLAVVLVAFVAGNAWLDRHHDPLEGARAWLEGQPTSTRHDPSWAPSFSGWSGRLSGEGEGGFSLIINEADDDTWAGTLTWIQSGRVDEVRGAYRGNHLVFPYPGPPWIERWWKRPGMLSTVDLVVTADGQLEGRDLVFAHSLNGQRAWLRPAPATTSTTTASIAPPEVERAPVVPPPIVLRPMIQVEATQIVSGRAFVLRTHADAEPAILTAASLFGPAGGLPSTLNPQMLPALVGDAIFFDLLDGAMRARGTIQRPPQGSLSTRLGSGDGSPDASRDLVTLALLPGHSLEPLELRQTPLVAGQHLWLPTQPPDELDTEEALLVGRVSAVWDQGYSVRFAGTVVLDGQVGAPLLDSQGRVAGMLVGQGDGERGASLGIAMPAHWIAARLEP